MRQRRFQVSYPGQKDGVALMMVIALGGELIPAGRVGAVFRDQYGPSLSVRKPDCDGRMRKCNQSSLLAIRMYGVVKAM
jgi:hypothetical protein